MYFTAMMLHGHENDILPTFRNVRTSVFGLGKQNDSFIWYPEAPVEENAESVKLFHRMLSFESVQHQLVE